jgi:hypothetical protein
MTTRQQPKQSHRESDRACPNQPAAQRVGNQDHAAITQQSPNERKGPSHTAPLELLRSTPGPAQPSHLIKATEPNPPGPARPSHPPKARRSTQPATPPTTDRDRPTRPALGGPCRLRSELEGRRGGLALPRWVGSLGGWPGWAGPRGVGGWLDGLALVCWV